MRRIVPVFALAAVAALFHVAAPPQATAATAIIGQLVDYTNGSPAGGTTLRLHQDDGGAPGSVVATAVTATDGEFSITPPTAGDYWVEVVRNGKVQQGYVQDRPTGPSWVQLDAESAAPVSDGTALGRVMAVPSFISGIVVNAANGNRLRRITVNTRDVVALGTVLQSDTTNADGFFRLPIWGEDFGLRVNGTARGFENGWRACPGTVVRTWGDACQSPIGRIGKVRLDRL